MLTLNLDVQPGTFYELGSGFFLPSMDLKLKTEIDVSRKLPISCMFDIYYARIDTQLVGFYFTTRFSVQNHGGYLITTLQNKGRATVVETLIKNDDLIVYHYPNRGTLAITPLVSDRI